MPVSVSLFELVRIDAEQSRDLWPTQFEGLLRKIEEDGVKDAATQWGALADLCQEEYDEPRLERGFRWLMKRPAVRFVLQMGYLNYIAHDLPPVVAQFVNTIDGEFGRANSIAGCVAHIVLALERIDEATQ